MTGLMMIFAALVVAWCAGVCMGAAAVEVRQGELRLPAGWWMLPSMLVSLLLIAAAAGRVLG